MDPEGTAGGPERVLEPREWSNQGYDEVSGVLMAQRSLVLCLVLGLGCESGSLVLTDKSSDGVDPASSDDTAQAVVGPDTGAVEFNLSHSHERVLYAFTSSGRIGIDVERIRADAVDIQIAKRFFSKTEAVSLASLQGADRSRAFFR